MIAMKLSMLLTAFLSITLGFQGPLDQDIHTFRHPVIGFSFSASGTWVQNPFQKDEMIYEMMENEKSIQVKLWYTGGVEMSPPRYLVKMADMTGLQSSEPFERTIDSQSVWLLETTGTEGGVNIHKTIAALSYREKYGEDAPGRCQGKEFNAVHIAELTCPLDRYGDNKLMMDGIISSLKLSR